MQRVKGAQDECAQCEPGRGALAQGIAERERIRRPRAVRVGDPRCAVNDVVLEAGQYSSMPGGARLVPPMPGLDTVRYFTKLDDHGRRFSVPDICWSSAASYIGLSSGRCIGASARKLRDREKHLASSAARMRTWRQGVLEILRSDGVQCRKRRRMHECLKSAASALRSNFDCDGATREAEGSHV